MRYFVICYSSPLNFLRSSRRILLFFCDIYLQRQICAKSGIKQCAFVTGVKWLVNWFSFGNTSPFAVFRNCQSNIELIRVNFQSAINEQCHWSLKSRSLSSWQAIILWIFLFGSTDHRNRSRSVLDQSLESYAGLTLIPRALSITRYKEKSWNKPAQCVTSRLKLIWKTDMKGDFLSTFLCKWRWLS